MENTPTHLDTEIKRLADELAALKVKVANGVATSPVVTSERPRHISRPFAGWSKEQWRVWDDAMNGWFNPIRTETPEPNC
jgi:hypothetical protein